MITHSVANVSTAHKAWTSLQTLFGSKSQTRIINLQGSPKGLGSEYTSMAAAIRSRAAPISYEELYEQLLDHEIFLQNEDAKKTPHITAAIAQRNNSHPPCNTSRPMNGSYQQ